MDGDLRKKIASGVLLIKDEAQQAVKTIEGVENVDNKIQILPPSPKDDRIRRQVARSLFNDDRLFRYSRRFVPPIHIIVSGEPVSLERVVSSEADKNTAGIRANSVPGVFLYKITRGSRIPNSSAAFKFANRILLKHMNFDFPIH